MRHFHGFYFICFCLHVYSLFGSSKVVEHGREVSRLQRLWESCVDGRDQEVLNREAQKLNLWLSPRRIDYVRLKIELSSDLGAVSENVNLEKSMTELSSSQEELELIECALKDLKKQRPQPLDEITNLESRKARVEQEIFEFEEQIRKERARTFNRRFPVMSRPNVGSLAAVAASSLGDFSVLREAIVIDGDDDEYVAVEYSEIKRMQQEKGSCDGGKSSSHGDWLDDLIAEE